MATTTKITVSDARIAIDSTFNSFMDGQDIDTASLEVIGYAVANEIQIRDYLMGVALLNDKQGLDYLNVLVVGVHDDFRHAFYSILTASHYALGDTALATIALEESLSRKPEYALSLLLKRVIGTDWAPRSFSAMALELHPMVIKNLDEIADKEIPDLI